MNFIHCRPSHIHHPHPPHHRHRLSFLLFPSFFRSFVRSLYYNTIHKFIYLFTITNNISIEIIGLSLNQLRSQSGADVISGESFQFLVAFAGNSVRDLTYTQSPSFWFIVRFLEWLVLNDSPFLTARGYDRLYGREHDPVDDSVANHRSSSEAFADWILSALSFTYLHTPISWIVNKIAKPLL